MFTQLVTLKGAGEAQYLASASPDQTDAEVELSAALFYGLKLVIVARSSVEAILT